MNRAHHAGHYCPHALFGAGSLAMQQKKKQRESSSRESHTHTRTQQHEGCKATRRPGVESRFGSKRPKSTGAAEWVGRDTCRESRESSKKSVPGWSAKTRVDRGTPRGRAPPCSLPAAPLATIPQQPRQQRSVVTRRILTRIDSRRRCCPYPFLPNCRPLCSGTHTHLRWHRHCPRVPSSSFFLEFQTRNLGRWNRTDAR